MFLMLGKWKCDIAEVGNCKAYSLFDGEMIKLMQ